LSAIAVFAFYLSLILVGSFFVVICIVVNGRLEILEQIKPGRPSKFTGAALK
jgi:hypothetical protein